MDINFYRELGNFIGQQIYICIYMYIHMPTNVWKKYIHTPTNDWKLDFSGLVTDKYDY